jgi:small-conductance mechanosensitive channel
MRYSLPMNRRLRAPHPAATGVAPRLWLATMLALLFLATPLRGFAADATQEAAAPASAAAEPASAAAGPDESAATLKVFNRPVVRFRVALPGLPPAERARRALAEVNAVLKTGGQAVVGSTTIPLGTMILIDGIGVFPLLPGDLGRGQTVDEVVVALRHAVAENREARTFSAMLRASSYALLATAVLGLALWGLGRLRALSNRVFAELAQRHGKRLVVSGTVLFSSERLFGTVRAVNTLLYFGVALVLAAEWVGFVLRAYPYTRPWGEELNSAGMEFASKLVGAIADSLPGLAVAIVIFLIARGVLGLVKPFFAQVERGELSLPWLDRYTVRATRGLVTIGVWLFALAMAYPYLPGSDTEAFKGISVLLGVMLSLGSSNFVGQAVSGLILTYSKTVHVGEYVRIAEVEGTVTEMGTFAIRIRTGLGEELTLPNAMIVGTITKNYSRAVKGEGYIVDTVMTIGYDTPWRQVHAMMIEGAKRTEGIVATPAPHVFQTALSDFYVEYRLVAQAIASAPRPRAQVLADLHANLQDVFNENGVQIMSPHYLGDPTHAKIVLPEHSSPPLAGKR